MPRFGVTGVQRTLIFVPIMSAPQTLASTAPPGTESAKPPSDRLLCLDIYRGLAVAGMILVDNPGSDDLAYGPMKHADWNGWTSADFIFPSFLFLVGISMVFSFAARLQRGESKKQILFHAFKRSLILTAIGLFVNASPIIGLDVHTWRFEGVTQRIALCYFAAAILVLWSGRRGAWNCDVRLSARLLGPAAFRPRSRSWSAWARHPVHGPRSQPRRVARPQAVHGTSLQRNARSGGNPQHDPGHCDSTLIGVLTGYWLRSEKSPGTKAVRMLCVGILGLAAGEVWNVWFPINKNLWTSSFVLFSGGFALVFLAFSTGCSKSRSGAPLGPCRFWSSE